MKILITVGLTLFLLAAASGQTWTPRTSGVSQNLNKAAFGNGVFVIAGKEFGGSGTVLTSTDNGVTWQARTSGVSYDVSGVTWGNGLFVAVRDANPATGETQTILTSPDGVTWTLRNGGSSQALKGVTYGNQLFIAVGASGTILTSTNGMNWTGRNSGVTQYLNDVVFGNGAFVVVGKNNGLNSGTILSSTNNGATWQTRVSGVSYGLQGVAYGNGLFVAVRDANEATGETTTIISSPDGVTWTARNAPAANSLNGVIYTGTEFVVFGDKGAIFTSSEGLTWNSQSSGTGQNINGGAFGNSGIVAVGNAGAILTSGQFLTNNVQIYTAVELEINTESGVTHQIQTSTDLLNWTNYESPFLGSGQKLFKLISARSQPKQYFRVQNSTNFQTGLIAYFPFNGNANDESGKNNHGVVTGATLTTDRFGQTNKAYNFNGTNNWIIASVPQIPTGSNPRTISVWAKATPDPTRGVGLVYYGLPVNRETFAIMQNNSPYTWCVGTHGGGNGVDTGIVVDSSWHHVVASYSDKLRIYFDGQLKGEATLTINTGFSSLFIGASVDLISGQAYPGVIDSVRVYDRALNASEVNVLYQLND